MTHSLIVGRVVEDTSGEGGFRIHSKVVAT
jgi:hypothetical protein